MSVVETPRVRTERARADQVRQENDRPLLRVVEPPRRNRARFFTFISMFLLFAVLMATVAFHVKLVQGQQHIDRLNRRADSAQARYDRLRVEVDRLESPARIVGTATKLGMVDPAESTWLAPAAGVTVNPHDAAGTSDESVPDDYPDVKSHMGSTP